MRKIKWRTLLILGACVAGGAAVLVTCGDAASAWVGGRITAARERADVVAKEQELLLLGREIQSLRTQIQRLEARIRLTLGRSALEDRDPSVVRDRKEVERLKGKITEISERLLSKKRPR